MSIITENIDEMPYTGVRKVRGKIRVKPATPEHAWLDNYFTGDEGYTKVENVTRGKEYEVVKVEGYGDVEDITIINDIGEECTLGSFFFEEK